MFVPEGFVLYLYDSLYCLLMAFVNTDLIIIPYSSWGLGAYCHQYTGVDF